ncbi:E3 ubiquitin-protein ligase RNF138-like [Discoglossus pictus]
MASASTSSDQGGDFYCPICQEIFQSPVKTQSCDHIFCRKCFIMAMKSGGAHCPLCRGAVCKRERATPTRAYDIDIEMGTHSGPCRYCDKKVKYSYMRHHYKSCKKYQEEYGILPKMSVDQVSPHSMARVDPTYKCPLCPIQNLNRSGLLKHCNTQHYFEIVETVCPICATLPWGDPNQKTGNVVDHLNARHKFDYEDFVNVFLDEEAQYQAAIEKSYQAFL